MRGLVFIFLSFIFGLVLGIRKRSSIIYAKNISSPGIAAYLTSIVLRRSLVLHTSGPDTQGANFKSVAPSAFLIQYDKFKAKALKRADLIIANSKLDEIALHYRFGVKNAVIIYNGVDSHSFRPDEEVCTKIRKRIGFNSDDFVVTYVGRPSPQKDLSRMLSVSEDFPNIKFLFIGPEFSELEKFGTVHENCFALGIVRNVSDYLISSDCFMLLSHGEGLSNAMLEAMSCSLPVVVNPAGDACYIIEDGKNGFLRHSIESIKEAIQILNDNVDLRRQIGDNARSTIMKKFRWSNTANQINKAFLEVL
ncbi:MAG: glycosyltransferase family 4 protein [Candidatus Heimdallarchaeota archaeon]